MTPNKEDYLKLIFELGGDEAIVSNKQIVQGLNVSAASVSEMMTKLLKEGYISHLPYQGVQLTEKGLQNASTLLRKHRLWEVFLVEFLGYSWNDVHTEAEVLEHVTSEILANRLENFLNHPETCPHGGIIPRENEAIHEEKLLNLTEYPKGTKIEIRRVLDEKDLLDYLVTLGLNIHDVVLIQEVGAYEGPITLNRDGKEIAVSYKAAHNIFVSPITSL